VLVVSVYVRAFRVFIMQSGLGEFSLATIYDGSVTDVWCVSMRVFVKLMLDAYLLPHTVK